MSDIQGVNITDAMTEEKRDKWIRKESRRIASTMATKFKMGRIEHDCDIGEQTFDYLLQAIEEELVDGLCYVREARRRLRKIQTKQLVLKDI